MNKNVPRQNIIVIESFCFELPPGNELNIKIQRDLMVNTRRRIEKSPLKFAYTNFMEAKQSDF